MFNNLKEALILVIIFAIIHVATMALAPQSAMEHAGIFGGVFLAGLGMSYARPLVM